MSTRRLTLPAWFPADAVELRLFGDRAMTLLRQDWRDRSRRRPAAQDETRPYRRIRPAAGAAA